MHTEYPKKVQLSRALRGQVRRATNRINTAEEREFPSSSNPDVIYRAVVMLDGKTMCDCRGWITKKRFSPRVCKHTRALINDRPTREDEEFVYVVRSN